MHLVRKEGDKKATVNNIGRTNINYRLVAVEELDLKESKWISVVP